MRLTLRPKDLKPEFQKKTVDGGIEQNCSMHGLDFKKFNRLSQAAIILVGEARYYPKNSRSFKTISPPDFKK